MNTNKISIALVLTEDRDLSTYPPVVNTAVILDRQKRYDITLIIPSKISLENTQVPYSVKIVKIDVRNNLYLSMLLYLISNKKKYDLFITFHSQGFVICSIASIILKSRVVYFCLEIYDVNNIRGVILRLLEGYFCKYALFIIVQDDTRESHFRKIFGKVNIPILKVPNTYIGICEKKTDYLRKKFNIPKDKIIVLYTGGIEAWALCKSLIESVTQWNGRYVLVLHGWSRDSYISEIKPLIDKINTKDKRIFINLEILKEAEYFDLVSSAEVGLVYYKKSKNQNVKKIGLSSGKLAAFLRCGLPIVSMSYLEGLREIKENNVVILVDDEYSIKDALDIIMNDYDAFSKNAFDFYCKRMDFEKNFLPVLSQIDRIFKDLS